MIGPSFDRYLVTLRMTRPARFTYLNHGDIIKSLLCNALGVEHLPRGVTLFACESGLAEFAEGSKYKLILTLSGESRRAVMSLQTGLNRIGQSRRSREQRQLILGCNFELESFLVIPPPDISKQAEVLADKDPLHITFVSPLRMDRPKELQVNHRNHFNNECFPAEVFFERVWKRIFLLEHGRWPTSEEIVATSSLGATGVCKTKNLVWLDMPCKTSRNDDDRQATDITIGGVLGNVSFHGATREWKHMLLLGSYLHAGSSTSYGIGRFFIHELADDSDPVTIEELTLDRRWRKIIHQFPELTPRKRKCKSPLD